MSSKRIWISGKEYQELARTAKEKGLTDDQFSEYLAKILPKQKQ